VAVSLDGMQAAWGSNPLSPPLHLGLVVPMRARRLGGRSRAGGEAARQRADVWGSVRSLSKRDRDLLGQDQPIGGTIPRVPATFARRVTRFLTQIRR
jgi:hypothetical protein